MRGTKTIYEMFTGFTEVQNSQHLTEKYPTYFKKPRTKVTAILEAKDLTILNNWSDHSSLTN